MSERPPLPKIALTKTKVLIKQANQAMENQIKALRWIDYKKAFDSVPHTWILKTLRMCRLNENINETWKHQSTNGTTQLNYFIMMDES